MGLDLTIVIIAANEEEQIARAIRSAAGSGRVLVIDGGSTDRTLAVARAAGAEVVANPWPGYAAQRRFALALIRTEWGFFLDADEEMTSELREELRSLVPAAAAGYRVRRRNFFLGEEMRHGAWGRDTVLRLFRPREAEVPERLVHEEVRVAGEVGRLQGALLHHAQNDFMTVGRKLTAYLPLMATEILRAGKPLGFLGVVARAKLAFLRDYLLRRGFLDGWRGFVLAFWGMASIIAKYAEARRRREAGDLPA